MLKVALFEDDHTMLSLLRTLLQIEGFQAIDLGSNINDIHGILEFLRLERPAIILLDVHLCRLNGFDLLREIRADDELFSMKVLMSSGLDLSQRCQDEGADGFILKPYMPEELTGKIQQLLGEQA